MRVAVVVLRAEADLDQHLHGEVAPFGRRRVGVDQQRLAQHVADLLARIERAIGVLEDDLHLAAHLRRHRAVGDVDLLAVDEQFARGRRVDQRDDAGERRLAAAAFADDRQRLALLDREADALHGMHGARLGEQAAADMVVAHDVAAFEDDLAHTPTPGTVSSSSTKPVMVGRRSPTAFSGSAESSARV